MSNALKTQGVLLEIDNASGSPTAWTAVGEVASITDIDSGQAADIDVTHLQSTAKEYLVGLPDGGTVSLAGNLVPSNAGQIAMRAARASQAVYNFRVTLTDVAATKLVFAGFVKEFAIDIAAESKVDFKASIRVTGSVAYV